MGCGIGITTNQKSRKAYWETVYKDVKDWQILAGPFDTKEEAQTEENRLTDEYGCDMHGGRDNPDTPGTQWHVYGFNHSGRS